MGANIFLFNLNAKIFNLKCVRTHFQVKDFAI